MIRVLQVVTYMGRGGLETLLMNYYRHFYRDQVQFDFLTHRDFEADYDGEIRSLGGRIYRLPRLNPMSASYRQALGSFFSAHPEYDIVHSHLDCMAGIPLREAAKHGVPVRIAHAHSASQARDLRYPVKLFYKRTIPKYATHLFACGEAAGNWMFGDHSFRVLPNAIDTAAFTYDPIARARVRAGMGIGRDAFVVGHVGRFRREKNHTFLLAFFAELIKKRPDAVLLLAGDGDLEPEMRKRADELGIRDRVIFAGARSDVPDLLSAMDIFCLPSLFEGLPLSVMEAQASGLPCLLSDRVPEECCVRESTKRLRLESSASEWADEILRLAERGVNKEGGRLQESIRDAEVSAEYERLRKAGAEDVRRAGYDICENAAKLQEFYLHCRDNLGRESCDTEARR